MGLIPSTSATVYLLLPYLWWEADDYFMGQASIAGLISHFDLAQDESEEIYTNTKIVLFTFTWLLLSWQTIEIRKLAIATTAVQSVLVMTQIFAPSTEILLIIRSLLGISGAVFPGALLSILGSPNKYMGTVIATFIAISPFGKSVVGPLISVVANILKDASGLNWKVIIASQSILGLLVVFILWMILPNPNKDGVPSEEYRDQDDSVNWKRNLMIFFKLRNILATAIYICCNMAAASAPSYLALNSRTSFAYVPYFFFTVFADLGPSHLSFNLLLIGPYLLSVMAIFLIAKISDKLQNRGHFAILSLLISALGFSIMSVVAHFRWNEWWSYFAIYPACVGCYCAMTITITWAMSNTRSQFNRGLVLTMLLGAGQLAAMFSPAGLKPWWRAADEPQHPRGLGMCAALMAAGSIIACGLLYHLAKACSDADSHAYAPLVAGYTIGEMEDNSDDRYML